MCFSLVDLYPAGSPLHNNFVSHLRPVDRSAGSGRLDSVFDDWNRPW